MWRGLAAAIALATATARAEEKPRCAVLDLRATGVDSSLADNVSAVLVAEVHGAGAFSSVISRRDIESMLSLEQQKQVLGCETDTSSCLAEIGGALGVERVVSGSLGKVGEGFLLNLQLIDVGKARVLERAYRRVPASEDALLTAVPEAVGQLLHVAAARPPEVTAAPARPAVRKWTHAPSAAAWAYPISILMLGGGVQYEYALAPSVALVGGAGVMVMVRDKEGSYGGTGLHLRGGVKWFPAGTGDGWMLDLEIFLGPHFDPNEGVMGIAGARLAAGYRWIFGGLTVTLGAGLDGLLVADQGFFISGQNGSINPVLTPVPELAVGWAF